MWVAKIKVNSKNTLIGKHAQKTGVTITGYPISWEIFHDGIYVHLVGNMFGSKQQKNRFITALKKESRTIHLETHNSFLIGQIKEPLLTKAIYNHKLLHVQPVIISPNGYQLWTLGSWKKQELTKLFTQLKKNYNAQLLKMSQEKIKNFSITKITPELTKKQEQAIQLAIQHGYYEYPRLIELKKLAKLMNISYSTYQAHLRKAERKLLPFFHE